MEHPVKTAPCPLLFEHNGGTLDSKGRPIFRDEDSAIARLNCDRAYDCGVCPLLLKQVNKKIAEGFQPSWECVHCISRSRKFDQQNNIEREYLRYFHSGIPDDEDGNSIPGCQHILEEDWPAAGKLKGQLCGWETPILQLILRRPFVSTIPASSG